MLAYSEYVWTLAVFVQVCAGFYCNRCGQDLRVEPGKKMTSFSVGAISSPMALSQANSTIDGVTYFIQEFINPAGFKFKVVQFNRDDILIVEADKKQKAVTEHTWFPGYGWKIAVCKHCGAFMGWIFEPATLTQYFADDDRHFVGVIIDHISFNKATLPTKLQSSKNSTNKLH